MPAKSKEAKGIAKKKTAKKPSKGSSPKLEWEDMIDTYSESDRHYNGVYLECDEVYGGKKGTMEVAYYSSDTKRHEIYINFGIMYGIIYTNAADEEALRKSIRADLEKEYLKSNKKPSGPFINSFCEKYQVDIPQDIFFNFSLEDILDKLDEHK